MSEDVPKYRTSDSARAETQISLAHMSADLVLLADIGALRARLFPRPDFWGTVISGLSSKSIFRCISKRQAIH